MSNELLYLERMHFKRTVLIVGRPAQLSTNHTCIVGLKDADLHHLHDAFDALPRALAKEVPITPPCTSKTNNLGAWLARPLVLFVSYVVIFLKRKG